MTGATRRITMIVLVLAVCAGPWGCAIKRPTMPQSPTDEVRAELKTIGLPVAGFVPEAQVDAPTSGKAMGALKGAGFGLAAGATPGMAIVEGVGKVGTACGAARELGALVCGAVVALGLGVAAAGGTVGALGGTVYGAVTAESGSKIDAAETELKSAVTQSNVQATLRDHVLQTVRDRSSLNFVAVDDHQTSAAGERIDYGALVSTDIDTVLEVSVPRIGLVAQSGINPPVSLFMTAGAKLIRTADGAEVYAEKFEYHGRDAYKFLEWAADEGQVFRQEVDRGARRLAEDIVRLLFPAEPARNSMPAEPSPEPPTAPAASTEPPAAATASSDPRGPTYEMVVTSNNGEPTPDPRRLAVLGTWRGTFKPGEGSGRYPARLRIFEESGELRWELTRSHEGRDLAGSGGVSFAGTRVMLTGTFQPSPGTAFQRVWTGSRPIDVTYSLDNIGVSLVGTGLGADNRIETLVLVRALGQ